MTTLATTNDHASLGNPYDEGCPTRHILDRIGDRWTVLIIGALGAGTLRFNELRRRVEGISQKMLTQTLRELERDGLILRREYLEVPVRVEYAPTEDCRRLLPILEQLSDWAEARMPADGSTTKKEEPQ